MDVNSIAVEPLTLQSEANAQVPVPVSSSRVSNGNSAEVTLEAAAEALEACL